MTVILIISSRSREERSNRVVIKNLPPKTTWQVDIAQSLVYFQRSYILNRKSKILCVKLDASHLRMY